MSEKPALPVLSEEEQRENREKMIPQIKAVLEVQGKIKEFQFVFYALVVIGFFLLIGGFISTWFANIIGLALMGGGLWFSKKQNDQVEYFKAKYGV